MPNICQWTGSVLLQVNGLPPVGAKPLPPNYKPMLTYYQLDPKAQTSVKFKSKYKTFHSPKCIWKYRLPNGGHFVWGEMSEGTHKSIGWAIVWRKCGPFQRLIFSHPVKLPWTSHYLNKCWPISMPSLGCNELTHWGLLTYMCHWTR